MKTYNAKPNSVPAAWYLVDATGKTLGRLASELARRIRGKHKPEFTPNTDTGDNFIVINAQNIRVTGKKLKQKIYYSFTGYPGGLKEIVLGDLLKKSPQKVIEHAVKGMLPKGPLCREMYHNKLKIYVGSEHPHAAQQPEVLEISE